MDKPLSAARQIRDEHAALAAVLNALRTLVEEGPGGDPDGFFDTVSQMLFYLDEFPERRHHPTESNVLFPMLCEAEPALLAVVRRLELDHAAGENRIRDLQHRLLAWRYIGEGRRERFVSALDEYVRFYLSHMATEESQLLPAMDQLSAAQRAQLDEAFEGARDPLAGGDSEAGCARLLSSITMHARNPQGMGLAREGR